MQGPPAAGCAPAAFNPKIVSRQTVSIGAQSSGNQAAASRVAAPEFLQLKNGFSVDGSTDASPPWGVRGVDASRALRLAWTESPTAPCTQRALAQTLAGAEAASYAAWAAPATLLAGDGQAHSPAADSTPKGSDARAGPHPDRAPGRPPAQRPATPAAGRRATGAHQACLRSVRRRRAVDAA